MYIYIMNKKDFVHSAIQYHSLTNCFNFLIAEEAIYMITEKRGSTRGKENLGARGQTHSHPLDPI